MPRGYRIRANWNLAALRWFKFTWESAATLMTLTTARGPKPEEPLQNTTERGKFPPGYVHQAARGGLVLGNSVFENAAP